MRSRASGFSLIELTLAVFIIGLVLGGLLTPLGSRIEGRQVAEAEAMLVEVRDALLGHAAVMGYLPCPDTNNDGSEDVTVAGVCISANGFGRLPYATLGVQKFVDPWGNRLSYRVELAYAQRSPASGVTVNSFANVRVCKTMPCPTTELILTNYNPADPDPGKEAVAVVLSHGRNGYGAVGYVTGTANAAPSSPDEIANTGAGPYVSRVRTDAGAAAGEFDDVLLWIGKPQLFGRMMAAGRLP